MAKILDQSDKTEDLKHIKSKELQKIDVQISELMTKKIAVQVDIKNCDITLQKLGNNKTGLEQSLESGQQNVKKNIRDFFF